MGSQPDVVDVSIKKEIKQALVQKIISNLETQTLRLKEMKASATFILDHLEKVQSYPQLIDFLQKLQQKWPIFKDVYTLYDKKDYKEKEKEVLNRLSSYIKSFN